MQALTISAPLPLQECLCFRISIAQHLQYCMTSTVPAPTVSATPLSQPLYLFGLPLLQNFHCQRISRIMSPSVVGPSSFQHLPHLGTSNVAGPPLSWKLHSHRTLNIAGPSQSPLFQFAGPLTGNGCPVRQDLHCFSTSLVSRTSNAAGPQLPQNLQSLSNSRFAGTLVGHYTSTSNVSSFPLPQDLHCPLPSVHFHSSRTSTVARPTRSEQLH